MTQNLCLINIIECKKRIVLCIQKEFYFEIRIKRRRNTTDAEVQDHFLKSQIWLKRKGGQW